LPAEPPEAAESPSVQAYSALYKEDEAKYNALSSELKKAESSEKPRIRERMEQQRQATAVRMIEMVRQQPSHEDSWNPLLWLSVSVHHGEAHDEAIRTLKKQFIDHPSLWVLLPEFEDSQSAETDAYLVHVEQKARMKKVRGIACFVLAARTQERAQREGNAALLEAARKSYERIIETYPDIRGRSGPLPEMVARRLKELEGAVAVGKPAPELVATDLKGQEFRLSQERGNVVVLSFSGHWCGPCVSMHPHERQLVERLAGQPFRLVEINSDESAEVVRKKMETAGLPWRCVHDGMEGPISKAWLVESWPVFVLIDKQGVIRRRANDAPGERLGEWVNEALGELE